MGRMELGVRFSAPGKCFSRDAAVNFVGALEQFQHYNGKCPIMFQYLGIPRNADSQISTKTSPPLGRLAARLARCLPIAARDWLTVLPRA
jgi:hypothetical protein